MIDGLDFSVKINAELKKVIEELQRMNTALLTALLEAKAILDWMGPAENVIAAAKEKLISGILEAGKKGEELYARDKGKTNGY